MIYKRKKQFLMKIPDIPRFQQLICPDVLHFLVLVFVKVRNTCPDSRQRYLVHRSHRLWQVPKGMLLLCH